MKEIKAKMITKGAGTIGMASIPLLFLKTMKGKWLKTITILAKRIVQQNHQIYTF